MIQPPVTLRKAHLFASRIAIGIGPNPVVKPGRLHNKRISLPPANRVAKPTGVGVLWKRSPVRPNGAPDVVLLEKHQHPAGNLNDLKWIGKGEKPRGFFWITAQDRIILLPRNGPWTY